MQALAIASSQAIFAAIKADVWERLCRSRNAAMPLTKSRN